MTRAGCSLNIGLPTQFVQDWAARTMVGFNFNGRITPVEYKMNPRETFETLRSKADGPVKKFELIKIFGGVLKESGVADPRTLSCDELETKIEDIIARVK